MTSTGRSFHVRAQETKKVQHPIVGSLTAGTSRSSDEEDRSLRRDDIHFVAVEKGRKQTKSFVVVRVFRDALRISVS